MNKDLYQSVTDQIVSALQRGITPWQIPWSRDANPIAMNVVSERPYRGVNVLLLNLKLLLSGYGRNRWLTYRQAASLGGRVRGGEKGVQILYYQLRQVPARDEADIADKVIPLMRAYTVFNVAQVDGLPQVPEVVRAWEEHSRAQALVDASGARVRHGGDSAFYFPAEDRIQLPPMSCFADAGGYYSTLLHELTHWSGHPTRCNRQLGKRFGDDAYAAEELIAEIGSAFLCAFCQISGQLQHASYVDHWIKVMRKDARAIFVASTRAQQAADFLIGRLDAQPEQEAA